MWPLNISERPPPEPLATPTIDGRPGCSSSRCTSKPRSTSQALQKLAMSASPAPPGTRSGLTELMETSFCRSSIGSSLIVPPSLSVQDLFGRALDKPRVDCRIGRALAVDDQHARGRTEPEMADCPGIGEAGEQPGEPGAATLAGYDRRVGAERIGQTAH